MFASGLDDRFGKRVKRLAESGDHFAIFPSAAKSGVQIAALKFTALGGNEPREIVS